MNTCGYTRKWTRRYVSGVLLVVLSVSAQAANIFEDSFDYGDTEDSIYKVSSWDGTSGYNKYDPDGGLENAQLYGETGGALWRDYPTGNWANHEFPDFALSNLTQGDTMWLVFLIENVIGTDNHQFFISGKNPANLGTDVSVMGVSISTNGSVGVYTFVGTSAGPHDSGIDIAAGTHLMVLRFTKGSGTRPEDSLTELWIDPSDTSSETALGTADFTVTGGKWGRDSESLLFARVENLQGNGRIDEIRLGQDFDDVLKIPPPPKGTVLVVR